MCYYTESSEDWKAPFVCESLVHPEKMHKTCWTCFRAQWANGAELFSENKLHYRKDSLHFCLSHSGGSDEVKGSHSAVGKKHGLKGASWKLWTRTHHHHHHHHHRCGAAVPRLCLYMQLSLCGLSSFMCCCYVFKGTWWNSCATAAREGTCAWGDNRTDTVRDVTVQVQHKNLWKRNRE